MKIKSQALIALSSSCGEPLPVLLLKLFLPPPQWNYVIMCSCIGTCISRFDKRTTVLSRAGAHGRSQLKRQNLRVGGYTKNSLKWFNYPHARAHPDAKLAAMGLNGLAMSVRLWFYKVDLLVASLLSFRSVQSSLAVREFRAAGEECCKRGHGLVCANLWCQMSWHPKCIRTIAAMCAQQTYLRIHYGRILAWWAVTRRTLKNNKTVKIAGVGACMGMGAC